MNKATMEFYGFTGDPAHDKRREWEIMRMVGPDAFDYKPGYDDGEVPDYEDDSGNEYQDYKNEEVRNLNGR